MNKFRIERRTAKDGTVKEYRYERGPRPVPASKTVRSAISDWQHSIEWGTLKPRTVLKYITQIHPFFEAFKDVPVKALTRAEIMGQRDVIANARGHGAALSYCQAVGALFAWCMDRNIVDISPAVKLTKRLLRGEYPDWTEEQAARALHMFPEPLRRVVMLGMNLGARRGDLIRMRWSDYDGSHITFTPEKQRRTKKPETLHVPVTAELRAELEAWRRKGVATLTILATEKGKPWGDVWLSQSMAAEVVKAGLPAGLNVHGLRKLAMNRLVLAGCTPDMVMSITGHKSLAMVQHYTKGARGRTLADIAVLKVDAHNLQRAKRSRKDG